MQLARRRAAWPAAPAPPRGPRCWRRVTVRAAPPPDDARGHSPAAGGADDPLPLVTQLEGDKDGSETFVTSAGVVQDVEEEDARFDYLGETTEGNLHFVQRLKRAGVVNLFGLQSLDGIVTADLESLRGAVQDVLGCLDVPPDYATSRPDRAIYCSRTLNLRSIKCIGYDLDYTLIHYDVEAWEGRAYEYGVEALRQQGVPVEGLRFDSSLVIRGLIMDKELGNLIKVDRFGLVKRAMHGTRMMGWQEIREAYGREVVNLRNEGRWVFLNTLFSISEAVLFCQLVDRLDQGAFSFGAGGGPGGSQLTYQGLYRLVAKALYRTHVEGKLKGEIIKDPQRFVELDPDMARTLLDQRDSGKMLLLITNSDYQYTSTLMGYAYDRFLPDGMTWRDLFDMVIVMARKPDFFSYNMSLYEVVTEDGLMRPVLAAKRGGLYCGGSARMVEKALGVEGDDILYVGDHIYTDAALAKINFRWRTALILRELEEEVDALARGRPHRAKLKELMAKKEAVGSLFDHLRLARQRSLTGRRPGMGGTGAAAAAAEPGAAPAAARSSSGGSGLSTPPPSPRPPSPEGSPPLGAGVEALVEEGFRDEEAVNETLAQLLFVMERLDDRIGPMLEQDGSHFSKRWGFLSRAGLNDKSQLCRQIEKYADVYTSRVSNFMTYTPYAYFRSPSQSLAHDRGLTAYYENVLRGGDGEGAGEPGAGAGVRKGAAAEHGGGRGQAAAAAGSGGAGGGAAAAAWGGGVSEEALSDGEPDVGGGGGGGEGGAQRPGSSPVAR